MKAENMITRFKNLMQSNWAESDLESRTSGAISNKCQKRSSTIRSSRKPWKLEDQGISMRLLIIFNAEFAGETKKTKKPILSS